MNVSATPAQEARRSTRHAPGSPTPVVDTMTDTVIGLVLDLSAGGMKLHASAPLVDAGLYQVQFALDVPGEGRVPIEAGMQVVGQRAAAGGQVAGLRYIHLPAPHAQRLGRWLRARGADGRH